MTKFTGYRDVDDWLLYEGSKVEIMDDHMIHKTEVVYDEDEEAFFIEPGFNGKDSREPLEDHVEGTIFQGRITEFPKVGASTG